MFLLIVMSLIFAGGSFGVSFWAKRHKLRSQAVAMAAQPPLNQLAEDAASVGKEMGSGSFRQEVKIRGKIVCDAPLSAELSQTPCVSYRFTVTREYEEVLWEKDASGNSVQRNHRKSEEVASNEVSIPFWLDDGTSRILVQPSQAKIEWIKTHSSFQTTAPTAGLTRGVHSLLQVTGAGGTLGYRYEEYSLPLDQEITVVAEAADSSGGQLSLRQPESPEAPFLITTKSPEALVRRNQTTLAVLRGVSIGLAAVAVLIFLWGVIR